MGMAQALIRLDNRKSTLAEKRRKNVWKCLPEGDGGRGGRTAHTDTQYWPETEN